ncbi:MAG: TIGR00266 family protein [Anaerolineales bacterium]
MADVIEYKVYGEELQLVEVLLDPGEGVQAEAGTMVYMEDGIQMQTTTGGGLLKGLKRVLTGESFFVTTFYNTDRKPRCVAFAAPYPGSVIAFDLDQFNGEVLCQKDSFLAAAQGTDIEVALTKRIGAGLFGGEGFILQRLKGDGLVFVHAGGTVIEKDLAAGESLRVDTGCIVAFASTVDYDIQFVGGFKNALFGGEGLFLARLTGPGKVYLQSLPFARLVDRIKRGITLSSRGDEQPGVAGMGGQILKGLISGS